MVELFRISLGHLTPISFGDPERTLKQSLLVHSHGVLLFMYWGSLHFLVHIGLLIVIDVAIFVSVHWQPNTMSSAIFYCTPTKFFFFSLFFFRFLFLVNWLDVCPVTELMRVNKHFRSIAASCCFEYLYTSTNSLFGLINNQIFWNILFIYQSSKNNDLSSLKNFEIALTHLFLFFRSFIGSKAERSLKSTYKCLVAHSFRSHTRIDFSGNMPFFFLYNFISFSSNDEWFGRSV